MMCRAVLDAGDTTGKKPKTIIVRLLHYIEQA